MGEIHCYHCMTSIESELDGEWMECPFCKQPVDITLARHWAAAGKMLAALQDPDLDPDLRLQLRRILHEHQIEVERRGLAASEAWSASEEPEPPPIPAAAASPEPSRAAPSHPAPARAPSRAEPPGEPSLWARLGPLFTENLLFALGGFLLLAGAVYTVTTAWTSMTDRQQLLVIVGSLELFGALLYGAARMARGKEGLGNAERVCLLVVAGLVPLAMVAAGQLTLRSVPLALLATGVVLASAWFPLLDLARIEDRRLHPFFTLTFTGLAAAILLAPHLGEWDILTVSILAALLVLAAWQLAQRLGKPAAATAAWIAGSLLALAASVFAGDLVFAAAGALPTRQALMPLGMLLGAFGAGAVLLEQVREPGANLRVPVLVSAFAVGITGVVVASGEDRALLVAAWLATATGLVVCLRLNQPALLLPTLGLSVVAYLFLPAPVRALAMEFRDAAAGSLGYEPQALPLSFYGLTFAPYLALVGLLTGLLHRFHKTGHARIAEGWLVIVALGLAAMSLVLGTDLRAPTAVLAADGAILIALGFLLRREVPVLLGTLGVYGSAVCGLVHLDAAPGLSVLTVAALGLMGLATATWLGAGRDPTTFRRLAARSVLRAVCLVAIGIVLWIGIPQPADRAVSAIDPAGYGLAAALVFLVAGAFRQPLVAIVAVPALVRALLGGLALFGEGQQGPWTPVALSLGMLIWLGAWSVLEKLTPARGGEPPAVAAPGRGLAIGLGALSVQLAGFWSLREVWAEGSWQVALGIASGASVLVLVGTMAAQGWCVWLAAFQLALAGILATVALGFPPGHLAGAIGVTIGAALISLVPRLTTQPAQRGLLTATAIPAALLLGALTGLWLFGARVSALPGALSSEETWSLMNGAILLVGLGVFHNRQGGSSGLRKAAAGLAGVLLILVPIAFLDLVEAGGLSYPFAFLATGALVYAVARRHRAALGLVLAHGAAALVVTLVTGLANGPGIWLQLAARAGAAVLAWAVLRRVSSPFLAFSASLLLLLGAALAVSLDIADGLLAMPGEYQPALLLALTAGFLFAARWRVIPINRAAAMTLALPVFLVALFAYGVLAIWIAGAQHSREITMGEMVIPILDVTAMGFIAMGAALGLAWQRGRLALWSTVLVLAAFSTAPINALVEGSREFLWRPDVECALIGVLMAGVAWWRACRAPEPRTREFWASVGSSSAYLPAALGVMLTAGELGHVSTPLTLLAVTAVPLLVLQRRSSGPHAALHGLGVLATIWSLTIYLIPETGRPPAEIFPVLALQAAALGWLLPPWGRLVFGTASARSEVPRQMASVGVFCLALALVAVAANTLALGLLREESSDGLLLALAVLACALVAGKALRLSSAPDRSRLVHLVLLAIIVAYSFVAMRTDWLSMLDGHHGNTLIAMALTLFLVAGPGATPRRKRLLGAAIFLPCPGLLGLLFQSPTGRTVTLFLVAVTYALGSLTAARRSLGFLALLFVNLALFSLWVNRDIFDPAFYGVPAGVSLLLVAEMARRQLQAPQSGFLRLTGLALLYGSVAIQVLRVETPWHALLLFALGLASVSIGFLRRNNALVLAGTIAVILDVVAYLATHGLERDFVGSFLLIAAGVTVLTVATLTARRRVKGQE
jgi:hypothetical protein